MSDISRRSVLKGASGSLAALAFAGVATDRQVAYAASRSVFTKGTTLANVATPKAPSGYARLTAGAGWALVVRDELVAAKPNRDDTRKALASIVQFTDLHMIDAQSPVRFEWLSTVNGSAFRPQEPLGSHGGAQLVKRINRSVLLRLVRARPGLSRAQLAGHSGLTKSTVSLLVRELVDEGWLDEAPVEAAGIGRPSTPLRLHGRVHGIVGVEIAVDCVRAAGVSLTGEVLWSGEKPLRGTEPAAGMP